MSDRSGDEVLDLAGLIQGTPYQNYQGDPSQGDNSGQGSDVTGQADNPGQGVSNEGLSPAASNTRNTAVDPNSQGGVTNQSSEGMASQSQPAAQAEDPRIAQLTETIQNQTRFISTLSAQQQAVLRQQQARDEQEFQRSLQDMDPEERQVAIDRRELQQLKLRQQGYQMQQQQQHAQQQQAAKNTLAMMVASDFQLNPQDRSFLLRATNYDDMIQIAQDLRARGSQAPPPTQQQSYSQPEQQQQQQQQQVNPAHLGGEAGGSSDVTPEIEYGSGDLMGLIQNTQWQSGYAAE